MDWRCEWCGKPHEEDNPPCDNCGHGTFERAVVPVADEGGGLGSRSAVWVCTECGREHTKHTPPCSRCGNEKLVRQTQEIDDDELVAPGYLDLVTPKYVVALVGVLALAALFILGLAGVVQIPGFGNSVPTVSDVPGDADAAGNLSLTDAEAAYLDALNSGRSGSDTAALTRNQRLDEVATFINQRIVKSRYGDGNLPSRDRISELVGGECEGGFTIGNEFVDSENYQSASALGEEFARIERNDGSIGSTDRKIGIDMHTAPDGAVYLTHVVC